MKDKEARRTIKYVAEGVECHIHEIKLLHKKIEEIYNYLGVEGGAINTQEKMKEKEE